jgi:branched-chain amino acid transport system permease protein
MQTLISGLSDGAIYGLIAMGMSITFYVTRVINFAHGQLLMVAVMVIAEGTLAHWALGLSILLAFVAAAGIAVLTYLIAVRPVIRRNRFNIIWVASTLGVSIILENGAAYFFGSDTVPFPVLLQNDTFTVGGLTISWQQVLAFFLALALGAGFEIVRKRSTLGKVGMAVAFDPEMASAVGVNTNTIAVGAFALSGVLCAVAAVLLGPSSFANPYMGDTYAIYGFIAFIVSKTTYPLSALYAGIVLGVVAEEANALINANAGSWFPFVVVLLLLVSRPSWILADGQGARPPRRRRLLARVDRTGAVHGS